MAFSNGSLPDGWIQRVVTRWLHNDVKRYFVSPEKSGPTCMLACILGRMVKLFFPKLGERQMLTFSSICDEYIKAVGCEKSLQRMRKRKIYFGYDFLIIRITQWCILKVIQQVRRHTRSSMFFLVRKLIWIVLQPGVIEEVVKRPMTEIDAFFTEMENIFAEPDFTKEEVVMAIKRFIPNFEHEEKGNLDQKM